VQRGQGGRSWSLSHARCSAVQGRRLAAGARSDAAAGQGECSRKILATRSCNWLKRQPRSCSVHILVLIFPGCRCDENDTLDINLSCDGVISGTVAMGAQAIRRYCIHTVNAVQPAAAPAPAPGIMGAAPACCER